MKYELTRISGVDLLHSAQISPPTASDCQIQIVEDKDSDEEDTSPQVSRKFSLSLRRRPRRVDTNVIFSGLERVEEYLWDSEMNQPTGGLDQNCLVLLHTAEYRGYDDRCDFIYYPVCQKKDDY